MSVQLTSEAEKDRLAKAIEQRTKPTWEHFRTLSIVEAVHKARDMGWAEKKVQVRIEQIKSDQFEFIIEPYEEGCGCHGLLKYSNFFGSEDKDGIIFR